MMGGGEAILNMRLNLAGCLALLGGIFAGSGFSHSQMDKPRLIITAGLLARFAIFFAVSMTWISLVATAAGWLRQRSIDLTLFWRIWGTFAIKAGLLLSLLGLVSALWEGIGWAIGGWVGGWRAGGIGAVAGLVCGWLLAALVQHSAAWLRS